MIVSAIYAMTKNRVIGRHNEIPWYLPADLKYFKKVTTGHHVIMGRNTFASIGRPLPNRTNVIITRDPFFVANDCLVAHSVHEALEIAFDNGESEAFIIGGGQIYGESLPFWDKLYLTEVEAEIPGDTYAPELNKKEWQLIKQEKSAADDKNEYACTFKVYQRKEGDRTVGEEE
jgi:dihydrofolate reductase